MDKKKPRRAKPNPVSAAYMDRGTDVIRAAIHERMITHSMRADAAFNVGDMRSACENFAAKAALSWAIDQIDKDADLPF